MAIRCGRATWAVAFLSREVPRWHIENGCFSCHNNGDAARALYAARRLGYEVPPAALLVLLALAPLREAPDLPPGSPSAGDLDAALRRGRAFLLDEQLEDGSWPETTRPPGQQSYAQYISTTGWATLALLETQALGVAP